MEVSNKQILPLTNQQWNENEPIMVSIVVAAFNHQAYIGQAIESFLVQETNFRVEILINDDASTDNTAQILKEYAVKLPNLFKNSYQTENQYSKGKKPWINVLFPNARGKYIAICEGDDYWIDSLKLQRQVDFLESEKEYSFCFHDAIHLNEKNGTKHRRIGNRVIDETPDLESVIIQNNIPTASLVFRNKLRMKDFPDWYYKTGKGDYALVILLATIGRGKYLPEVMSVYRIHEVGVWNSKSVHIRYEENVRFYAAVGHYLNDERLNRIIKLKIRFITFNNAIIKFKECGRMEFVVLALRNFFISKDKRIQPRLLKLVKELLKKN